MAADEDDLVHLRAAIDIVNAEKAATRALIHRGDRATNKVVTNLGLLAALFAIATTIGPLVFAAWFVVVLGIVGGTAGGAAVFMQSRWTARRSRLDEEAGAHEDLLLLFSKTSAEIEGRDAVLQLQRSEQLQLPSQTGRRRRKRKKKPGKAQPSKG